MTKKIFGIHSVKSLLQTHPKQFHEVFILKNTKNYRLLDLINSFKNNKILIHFVERKFLNKLTNHTKHQGIIANVTLGKEYKETDLLYLLKNIYNPFLLILDEITDPHNLGSCIRTANAAGVHAVIITRNRSAKLNSIAKKVACGATEITPVIQIKNLARTLSLLRKNNVWIIGTAEESKQSIYKIKITDSVALVMGNEGKGMRHLTKKYCDEIVNISIKNKTSSLNVSVATGIGLFEIAKIRNTLDIPNVKNN